VCAARGVVFILNDRPDLVAAVGADGVHVGQDDIPVAEARRQVGEERVVGLSTHSPAQIDAAAGQPGLDYIGVGPVHATPTKPGRPAVGLELVGYAAAHAATPFFAIGGIDTGNVAAVRAAGARRIAVVRAVTESADPAGTARRLRRALESEEPLASAG
jgi:thiamine-phosphate pyrophosphorylase